MYYIYLYLFFMATGLFVGFVFTSHNAMITDNMQTRAVLFASVLFISIIICSVLEKSLAMGVFAVLIGVFSPGIGQTITLLITGRRHQISTFSWIITGLFVFILLYVIMFGRIVKIH